MDCISASVITWSLGATFDFNAKVGRPIGIRRLDDFNGVHRFGLHPLHTPCAGMNCLGRARNVLNIAIRATVVDVWRLAACVPTEKKTRPAMVMHGHRRAGRNIDFQHAYECVFKNYSVTLGRGLDSIEAVGEVRFVLPIDIKIPGEENKATNG